MDLFDNNKDPIQLAAIGAVAVSVVGILVIAFTTFGSHSDSHTLSAGNNLPAPQAAPVSTASDESTPSSDGNTTGSAAPVSSAPGATLMTEDQTTGICNAAMSSSASNGSTGISLLPGGNALLTCPAADASNGSILVDYDLIGRSIHWQHDLTSTQTFKVGTKHAFVLDVIKVDATGLADAYQKYTLAALDIANGAQSWTIPLEDWVAPADRQSDSSAFTLTEGPSGQATVGDDVVVGLNGTSAFATSSGGSLWHTSNRYTTPASGNYVANGIVQVDYYQGPSGSADEAGVDARSGNVVWLLHFPEWFTSIDGNILYDTEGTTVNAFKDGGLVTYSLLTGRVTRAIQFPSSWSKVLVNNDYAVASVGGKLNLFRLSNTSKAVWGVAASNDVTVYAASIGHLLVSAPSGYLLLSAADGSTTTTLASLSVGGSPPLNPVDGLLLTDSYTILEMDPPTDH